MVCFFSSFRHHFNVVKQAKWAVSRHFMTMHGGMGRKFLCSSRLCDIPRNEKGKFSSVTHILVIQNLLWNVFRWMTQNAFDDRSTLVQVMAWCRQPTRHCVSQSCPVLCRCVTCYWWDLWKQLITESSVNSDPWRFVRALYSDGVYV